MSMTSPRDASTRPLKETKESGHPNDFIHPRKGDGRVRFNNFFFAANRPLPALGRLGQLVLIARTAQRLNRRIRGSQPGWIGEVEKLRHIHLRCIPFGQRFTV